jgi:hypothetical protein
VNLPRSARRDWHQFRLLSRDAVRQLIDTALFSRESDPMEFALWMLALVATPPAFFAARQIFAYTSMVNAPADVVEQMALAHRLFFVTYGMLASALLAALTWEAIFPDGRDQEIVGVLPVRPQTFAAARLSAAITLGAGFAAAVNIPTALIYTMVSASHPAFRNMIGLLSGHVLGTMLASLFVFFTLLTTRGVAAVLLGARAGAWLGAALQLVTVVLLVEVFFFLPGVLGALVDAMFSRDPAATRFPPVWFASLHAWTAGNRHDVIIEGARTAAIAVALAAFAAVPVYLLPARWLARRALESLTRDSRSGPVAAIAWLADRVLASPPVRGILIFSVASLVRSRRHLLILATYVGLAIAVCVVNFFHVDSRGTPSFAAPVPWLFAMPLVFMFFLTLGLRSSFRVPTELEANWPFRLSQPSLATCVNAAALVMFAVAVLPISLLSLAVAAPLWAAADVIKGTLLLLVAGVTLIECVLLGWSKVPFACGHAPSPSVLKAQWPLYTMALYLYAFRLSDWQVLALRSTTAMNYYLLACALTIGVVRVVRYYKLRHQSLEFDAATSHTVERLNLSGALN